MWTQACLISSAFFTATSGLKTLRHCQSKQASVNRVQSRPVIASNFTQQTRQQLGTSFPAAIAAVKKTDI
jgi:hypothetical protein